ncbi:type II CAAX endopeptidase family protein [Microbispora sp. NPDC046973]|uniref:CPBP family intramembrane glutamic endopeptidase n=1 Tax=Microbispora sp. NPDC046973 TaxID=3155022 RepID=UPI0033C98150
MRATTPPWAVSIAVVVMFVQAFSGPLIVGLLMQDGRGLLAQTLSALTVTLVSIALVFAVRRFLGRQSWQGVRLTWSWSALWQALAGVLIGAVAVVTAKAYAVALFLTDWVPWWETARDALPYLPLALAIPVLNQAFPEELLWRGHVYDTLSARLPTRVVVITVAGVFGALHVFSQGGADTLLEKLLYIVTATALGLACTVARMRSGAVWMAVGVHGGFHIGLRLTLTQEAGFGAQLALMAGALVLAAWVVDMVYRARPHREPVPVPVPGETV